MRFCVVVVVAAGVAGSIAPGSALAQAPEPEPDQGQQVDAPPLGPSFAPLEDLGTVAARRAVVSLHAGHPCYGQTDNPHNSGHFPGYALVTSRTVCAPLAPTVTVDLYRELFGSWYFLDRGGPRTQPGTATTNARWRCPSGSRQHFRGVGYHSAPGHAPANTANDATFTCT
jgi:hypothetical protein